MKVLCVLSLIFVSACTGPFGMVLGGERIHEIYNRRYESLSTDYHAPDEKLALQRELDKRRPY